MRKAAINRVREFRVTQGLSQVALAEKVSLSRQSLRAIETGLSVPAVDVALRLASTLGSTVEHLFGDEAAEPLLSAEPAESSLSTRLSLAHIGGRWVSYPLDRAGLHTAADGLATRFQNKTVEVRTLRPRDTFVENTVVMGCSLALGLLCDRLNGAPGKGRYLWRSCSSTQALESLARQQTHLAAIHLVDDQTGESNIPDIRHWVPRQSVTVITLGRWEAGLVTAPGNPLHLKGIEDLAKNGLRFVVREEGSGSRRVLNRALSRMGMSVTTLSPKPLLASGHLEVAQLVSYGAADIGVATRDSALAFGLTFIPLTEERIDLVIPHSEVTNERVVRFLDVMTTRYYREELSSLGYDMTSCGNLVADINAA